MFQRILTSLAGAAAGVVNGLFGAGGGMVLVPLLGVSGDFTQEEIFSSSLVIILPICLVSLAVGANRSLPWQEALPFLIGSIPGGILAATLGKKLSVNWLHRILGTLIIYAGVRYLW